MRSIGLTLGLGLLLCGPVLADVSGVVFVDANGNGVRDAGTRHGRAWS